MDFDQANRRTFLPEHLSQAFITRQDFFYLLDYTTHHADLKNFQKKKKKKEFCRILGKYLFFVSSKMNLKILTETEEHF